MRPHTRRTCHVDAVALLSSQKALAYCLSMRTELLRVTRLKQSAEEARFAGDNRAYLAKLIGLWPCISDYHGVGQQYHSAAASGLV
jgi:hypothetical protein